MQPQPGLFTLVQKLKIITAYNNGRLLVDLCSDHSVDESIIECVMARSPRFKKGTIKQSRIQHLRLSDKLHMLHLLHYGVGSTELFAEFKYLKVLPIVSRVT